MPKIADTKGTSNPDGGEDFDRRGPAIEAFYHHGRRPRMRAQMTLRQGFEVTLEGVAPEIEEIVGTTNRAAGKQPFYPRHELEL